MAITDAFIARVIREGYVRTSKAEYRAVQASNSTHTWVEVQSRELPPPAGHEYPWWTVALRDYRKKESGESL